MIEVYQRQWRLRHLLPLPRTAMPRILPRLIKALQRPPGPFDDELRIAPGLRSKTHRKTRTVPPHKQRIPVRVSRPAAEYSRSLLLDEESQVRRRKAPSPVVKYQGQDGARLMNEDELRWWSNPYSAYASRVLVVRSFLTRHESSEDDSLTLENVSDDRSSHA